MRIKKTFRKKRGKLIDHINAELKKKKKTFSTKLLLYPKMFLQYSLLQGWDEYNVYLQRNTENFNLCI